MCSEKGLTPNSLCRELGLSGGVVKRWKNDEFPSVEHLMKISDCFRVSVDYLIGRTHLICVKKSKPKTRREKACTGF